MASQVMRITLKAYDHQLVDQSAGKIIETVKKTGSKVSGPVPLPTKKEVVTILRAVHKYKDSREQFLERAAGHPQPGQAVSLLILAHLEHLGPEGFQRGSRAEFFIAAGISYGYAKRISRNLHLEFNLGIGVL